MRLIFYLVLAVYCSLAYATKNVEKKLVKAYIDGSSSERQFIGNLRKWIFGRGGDKELSKAKTKTKVKYLPIYVPVPVYSDAKGESYGAHQQNKMGDDQDELEDTVVQVPTKTGLPFAHTSSYNLPYGSQVYQQVSNRQLHPMYYMPYGEQLTKPAQLEYPYPYYSPYYGAYEYVYDNVATDEEPEETDFDSEVIDNPELLTEPDKSASGEVYTRKRRRYRKSKK